MRHLIIGASGQVGEALTKLLFDKKQEIIGTFFKTPLDRINKLGKIFILDITKQNDVERLIADINPDVIYIPAAITNVDYCEQNPKETYAVNVEGITNIINSNKNAKIEPLIVFFSSDYIFDGTKGSLYNENDIPNPICEYGKQKLSAEHYIATKSKHFIIIRTCGIFGPETQGKNFVLRLIKNLSEEKEVTIPNDEYGTPTYSPDLVDAVFRVINNIGNKFKTNVAHVINIVGSKRIRRYDFAIEVAKIFNYDVNLIKPINSYDIVRAAKRPLNSGLTVDKIEAILDRRMMYPDDGLKALQKII